MSRVYFTSADRESELHGSERAYLGSLVSHLALSILDPRWRREELERLLNYPDRWRHLGNGWPQSASWIDNFSTSWSVGGDTWLAFEGRSLSPFEISLNTATLIGSPQLKAAAWIHGQCEVHGYVEGKDRAWLADIFEEGVETGIYRRGLREIPQGWEDVIEHLRENADGPVVMGYSVTDSFPSDRAIMESELEGFKTYSVTRPGSYDLDLYYELPQEEKWEVGMRWLNSNEANLGAFGPDRLDRTYGCSVTAFDLFDDDRLREKLGTPSPVS